MPWDASTPRPSGSSTSSPRTSRRCIAAKLGNPTVDPHGDPIPTRRSRDRRAADALPRRRRGRRARVLRARLRPGPGDAALPATASGSRPARTSRSSRASRSAARSPSASRATSTSSAAAWPRPCGWSCVTPPTTPPPRARSPSRCPSAPSRAAGASAATAFGRAVRCSGRPSWPPWPTSIRGTSPRTSRAAPSSATCCSGSSSRPTSWPWSSSTSRPSSASSRTTTSPRRAASGSPARRSVGLWLQAELICMSTDIAEIVGAAIALNLLFHVPLVPAGVIAA